MIHQIRTGLKKVEADENTSSVAMLFVQTMLVKFEEEFGTGEAGTVFDDHLIGGPMRRLKGFPLKLMIATALDPRTKTLVGKLLHSLFLIPYSPHLAFHSTIMNLNRYTTEFRSRSSMGST